MNYNEALEKFSLLFENKMSKEEAKKFLVELYEKEESAVEIAAAAKVMREHSIKLHIPKELQDKIIDNCGTGGDKSNTFNILNSSLFNKSMKSEFYLMRTFVIIYKRKSLFCFSFYKHS